MSKQEAYYAGHYQCPPPYVSFLWTTSDWIRHIDQNGRWTVEVGDEQP
ncbi:hypothetical protein LAh5_23 [Aeromonas phage LAh5]|nr:hypothetical protein LAh4_22 [Aeromonas phage LAh4]QDH46474.1 hypothetical protein LAh5_23 [Aeromonas phage LAh5]